jgi:hypothetical protein
MDVDNRVVLDIIPTAATEHAAEETAPATPQSAGDPQQPAAPPPQVPEKPAAEPESPVHANADTAPVQSNDPADVPPQTKPGSGPLHP